MCWLCVRGFNDSIGVNLIEMMHVLVRSVFLKRFCHVVLIDIFVCVINVKYLSRMG